MYDTWEILERKQVWVEVIAAPYYLLHRIKESRK